MSKHAIERIQQRYGREFNWKDIRNLIKAIREDQCYILDAAHQDRIICLVLYNNCPLKLIYSVGMDKKGCIVTAMPLDVDEWNKYSSEIPHVITKKKK